LTAIFQLFDRRFSALWPPFIIFQSFDRYFFSPSTAILLPVVRAVDRYFTAR
jgi:hypothetical protein